VEIIKKNTPNFRKGRSGMKPVAVVIHIMDGTLTGTDSWFASEASEVSAHYGVGRNGEVHQYVEEADTAFHCGTVKNPSWPGLVRVKGRQPMNPNLYTVGIEHEGSASSEWTPEMYATSAELIAGICARWGIPLDRQHIIRHSDIRADKACPGHEVDLERLIALAQQVKV
jgi:N-acetylmuramoyl-L-alanine amidase